MICSYRVAHSHDDTYNLLRLSRFALFFKVIVNFYLDLTFSSIFPGMRIGNFNSRSHEVLIHKILKSPGYIAMFTGRPSKCTGLSTIGKYFKASSHLLYDLFGPFFNFKGHGHRFYLLMFR